MDINTARTAGDIAAQIDKVTALISEVDVVIAENWPVTVVRATAPAEGASRPAGSQVDLLPNGIATPESWKFAVSTARQAYQDQLDTLLGQLEALK